MLYDKNYREQFFWDNDQMPPIRDLLTRIRQVDFRDITAPPPGKEFKPAMIGLGAAAGGALAVGLLAWLITKAGVFGLVLGLLVFFGVGIVVAFIVARMRLITEPSKMTMEVNAKCIGYSLSGNNNGGGISRTPVFEYTVNGRDYTAYDGVYTRHPHMPAVDEYTTIWVNPEEPEYFKWSDAHNRKTFTFICVVCACVALAWIGMLILVIRDPGLRDTGLTAITPIVSDILQF